MVALVAKALFGSAGMGPRPRGVVAAWCVAWKSNLMTGCVTGWHADKLMFSHLLYMRLRTSYMPALYNKMFTVWISRSLWALWDNGMPSCQSMCPMRPTHRDDRSWPLAFPQQSLVSAIRAMLKHVKRVVWRTLWDIWGFWKANQVWEIRDKSDVIDWSFDGLTDLETFSSTS